MVVEKCGKIAGPFDRENLRIATGFIDDILPEINERTLLSSCGYSVLFDRAWIVRFSKFYGDQVVLRYSEVR